MLTEALLGRARNWRPNLLFVTSFALLILSFTVHAQTNNSEADGKSSFTARLMNIEAAANETFRYNASLHNGAKEARIYELKADLPIGWMIAYKVEGSQVTSLNLESGKTQDISIEINATSSAKPDKYKIPIRAISAVDTLVLNLEAVVKGSYALELTTPSGRLSDEITSGKVKEIQLTVKNTGTLPLTDVELSAQNPSRWETTFEPSKIKEIEPGKSVDVTASLKVPDKTIAGDYVTTITAKNSNSTSQLSFRMTVKTSLLSGWIGVLVILAAIGLVYYLIRKYGRR
ncbi:hypothetical protein PIECOFPK_02769 [Mycovorax composti]|jgi:Predicted membrane protein|uniref:Alpha-galactosidase NEW3 domain-containing protein n=2 Tax=Chitinophagaceae TaxID=563835 RepID=A0ABZ2ENW8_9BACT